ncbi:MULTISPECIES: hypothetical protein [Pseudomonadota]|uniref:apolipoprotein C-I n=3 Tax=cellular organisms TaxID=131567 RepID=UPI001C1F1ECA|nr:MULTISPECIES: hypothetical protein [Pseudomonadota]MBU7443583.1 hypothetical protein [Paraburkholderia fungorum]MCQ4172050.1 hypothetical protein [Hafnia paralvei]
MRLYLAVAVLMLAFVAYTEAQEETIEQTFARWTEQAGDLGRGLGEKARTTFSDFFSGEQAANAKNWLNEQFEKIKTKVQEIAQ